MKPTARDLIQDAVLRGLIYSPQGVDAPTVNEEDKDLWDNLDDDTPAAPPDLNVKDVPGGTITYAFERLSMNL
jgi:hypothetical protein